MKLLLLMCLVATPLFFSSCVAVYRQSRVQQTYPHGQRHGDHRLTLHAPPYDHFLVDIDSTTGRAFSLTAFRADYRHTSGRQGALTTNLLTLPHSGTTARFILHPPASEPKLPVEGSFQLSLHYSLNGRSVTHDETITRTSSVRATTYDPAYLIPNYGFSRSMQ